MIEGINHLHLPPVSAVPAVAPAGYYIYTGTNPLSVMNQARNASIDRGDDKQLKLQMSLNNCHPEEAGQLVRMGNPGAVSTGLRLSYEDDERNSSITSRGASLSSLPTTMSFADDLMAQMDKENKEMGHYLKLQVNIH
jgi:E3 ubiquitin-protein ligase BOI and related proteins